MSDADTANAITDKIIEKIKDYTIVGMKKGGITKALSKTYSLDEIVKAWKKHNGNHKDSTEKREITEENLYDEVIRATKDYIKDHHTILTMDNDEALIFIDGYYHLDAEKLIHNMLLANFKEHEPDFSADKILEIIRGTVMYIQRDEFAEPVDKINVKNGVLDISEIINKTAIDENGKFNINKVRIEPHNPTYKFLHKYKWNYLPDADCPKIKEFLKKSVKTYDDYLCLQEYIGFCLYPDYLFDVFLVLFGKSGHNHKSKTVSLVRKFLGSEVVSSVSPENLQGSKFSAAHLYGMKANISSEISRKVQLGYELKKLLGHDVIFAEKKFKGAFQFHNRAKLIFTWNEIPEVSSPFYDAFWNKPIVLEFSKSFTGEDSDKMMKELTTSEEMSGFLNFALEGLARLLKNNKFTYDDELNFERWHEYRDIKNPILNFFTECIDYNTDSSILKSELYVCYERYCKLKQIAPESKKNFGICIKDLQQYKNGMISEFMKCEKRSWKGINLKEEFQEAFQEEFQEEESQEAFPEEVSQ